MKARNFVYLAVCAALALSPVAATAQVDVKEAVEIATDAYVYGYSLVTTDVTRIQMSNVPAAEELKAPLNQFANVKRYPPADYRGVSAPNADTLYSVGWLDLAEPQVFSHPDMGKRYFLFPMDSRNGTRSLSSKRRADSRTAVRRCGRDLQPSPRDSLHWRRRTGS